MIPLINAYITNIYGQVASDGKTHKGLDIISSVNDRNVKAIKEGIVSYVGYDATGFGNYVSISQNDGYRVIYAHLQSYQVVIGQNVKEGQIIGVEGTTGNSTGIHLHLEIRKNPFTTNDNINPAEYLGIKNQRGAIEYIENNLEEDEEVIKKLIEEYGEELVYEALKSVCEKKKNENIVPDWAKEEYEDAVKEGITDGTRPQGLATRVETAVMIERATETSDGQN